MWKMTILIICIVQFQKKVPSHPGHRRSLEIPRGRRVLKVKILEAKYEAKVEFPGGTGGAKQKTFHGASPGGTPQNLVGSVLLSP